jgi:phenylacetate-CoA ligase
MIQLRAAACLLELKRNQWRSAGEVREIAERRMLALLDHARNTTAFYRKRLAGITIRSLDGLHALPATEKCDVRDSTQSFISSAYRADRLISEYTSGSTGIQVPIFRSPRESGYGVALEIHHLTECGAALHWRQARITHYETPPNPLQRLGVFRCSYLPVQGDEAGNMDALLRMRPEILVSYPSILLPLARANNAGEKGLRLRMALAGGEMLSGNARSEISQSFGCPVYDRFGTMESSWAAWECRDGALHIQDDFVYVEILDERGEPVPDGRSGRIALTPLWRRAMPLIRYLTGDRGSIGGRCRCGRGLRTLRLDAGREDDGVVLPSGRVRSARSINLMDDIQGILSYQIVQKEPGLFLFRYVPGTGLGKEGEAEVARLIRAGCLGEEVKVEFEAVASLPRGKTGKLQAVISKVGHGERRSG